VCYSKACCCSFLEQILHGFESYFFNLLDYASRPPKKDDWTHRNLLLQEIYFRPTLSITLTLADNNYPLSTQGKAVKRSYNNLDITLLSCLIAITPVALHSQLKCWHFVRLAFFCSLFSYPVNQHSVSPQLQCVKASCCASADFQLKFFQLKLWFNI